MTGHIAGAWVLRHTVPKSFSRPEQVRPGPAPRPPAGAPQGGTAVARVPAPRRPWAGQLRDFAAALVWRRRTANRTGPLAPR